MKSKQSDAFRENAQNCAEKAEGATDESTHNRFKRMEAAWLALAEEQDWLDGETNPTKKPSCPCRKLDPDVLVVQSAEDWHGQNAADGLDVNRPGVPTPIGTISC